MLEDVHGRYQGDVRYRYRGTCRPIVVILEDDLEVSPHYWRWLKVRERRGEERRGEERERERLTQTDTDRQREREREREEI